ncbi:MAG: hypothetical protein U0795_08115 [Pirellulales bacterium]
MSDAGERSFDERLELYLDDQLSAQERAEFERRLADDPSLSAMVARQRQLDAKLRAQFGPPPVAAADVERWLIDAAEIAPATSSGARGWHDWQRWLSVAAACLLLMGTFWGIRGWVGLNGSIQPYFESRPLTTLYTESVREGFQPYYFCEDAERFAATFARRQQVPLELAAMPPDRRMIGLSYSGGFTRDTTAILCQVHDRPVVVYVDRRAVDRPEIAQPDPNQDLFVHRRELGDLVMYEVSPFDSAQILDYLHVR